MTEDKIRYWFVNYVVMNGNQVDEEVSTIIPDYNRDFFPLRKMTTYFSKQRRVQEPFIKIRNFKEVSKDAFDEFQKE